MKFKILISIIFLIVIARNGYSQNYTVYNFKQLEPLLNQKNDTTYVINFWATWCKPCIEEMPAFNQLHKNYSDKKLRVILVSLDFGKDYQVRVKNFAERHSLKPTIVILDDPNSNAWIDKVSPEWSGALPATLIFNKNKRLFFEQSFTYEELEKEVKKVSSSSKQ
jgi:thiol-disulfide isomerase/thioredoxin